MQQLNDALRLHGLMVLGQCPAPDTEGEMIHLIGPDEPAFWPIFESSTEYRDARPNPLDRWSDRVLTDIAADIGAKPLFPFGGPPFAPFFTWAVNSGHFWQSPIGFLVHDTAGLFVSFRGALQLPGTPETVQKQKPCDTCSQPCATACPVGAFGNGYDVTACKAHVLSDAGTDCRTAGCLARRACPVGHGNRLPVQAAFHMEAFL